MESGYIVASVRFPAPLTIGMLRTMHQRTLSSLLACLMLVDGLGFLSAIVAPRSWRFASRVSGCLCLAQMMGAASVAVIVAFMPRALPQRAPPRCAETTQELLPP